MIITQWSVNMTKLAFRVESLFIMIKIFSFILALQLDTQKANISTLLAAAFLVIVHYLSVWIQNNKQPSTLFIYILIECATTIIPDSYAAIKIVVLIHLVFPEHTSCCEDTIIDLMLSISKSVLQQVYVVLWLYSPRKASVSYRKCIPFLQQYLR